MRLLANENIPAHLVESRIAGGADGLWIATYLPGASDRQVLAIAVEERRIRLTFDKDFGQLARLSALPAGCGVILCHLPMLPPAELGTHLSAVILSNHDWMGHFSVVEPGRTRMRPLQKS